jgi:homocysteine S-methyltransferase
MSSHALAVLLERETGMETVLQYSCRDKSLLAMQSDVLGLHALGLRNLLLITGDPQKSASYLDATVVYDVDSIGFANMVNYLNHGLDLGGDSIGEPCAFFIGVSANPSAINLDEEVRRFEHKVDAGAEYCVTQPVFDVGALEQFMKRIQNHRIPVIAGIWPLDSYRTAEFLNNELPDVVIPKEVIERMRHADSMGRARAEGIIIAREQALCMKPLIQGLHFITASLRYAYTVEIMELMESFTAQA